MVVGNGGAAAADAALFLVTIVRGLRPRLRDRVHDGLILMRGHLLLLLISQLASGAGVKGCINFFPQQIDRDETGHMLATMPVFGRMAV